MEEIVTSVVLISFRVQKKRIELILIFVQIRRLPLRRSEQKRRRGGGGGESKASKITIQWMIHQGPGPSLNHVARNNTPAPRIRL